MNALTSNADLLKGVAIFGIVATQIMNLSAAYSIVEIVKAKSTLLYPTFPFTVSLMGSATSVVYSVLSDQQVVGLSSIMTIAQSSVYLSVHIYFSLSRWLIVRELVLITFIVSLSLAVGPLVGCFFEIVSSCQSFVKEWFGLVMAIISCARYSSQSFTFYQVVQTKNAASISPAMTAGAMFASITWTIYSILAGDPYYLASGVCGTVASSLQVFFLLKYPRNVACEKNANGME